MKPLYNLNPDQEARPDEKFDTDSVPERLLEKARLPSMQRVKHAFIVFQILSDARRGRPRFVSRRPMLGQSVLPARWQIHRERGLEGICVCHGLLLGGVSHWLSSGNAALVVRKKPELWNWSVEQVPPKLTSMHPLNTEHHADVSS